MSSIFKNRFIYCILFSALFLQMGIWIRNFSILLFVTEQTNGNAIAISFIMLAEYAPIFLFSFLGGTFADRWRPKKTMVWCDILTAISIFAIFAALLFSTWKVVFFITLISAVLSQLSQPAGMKLFKQNLPDKLLQPAMSLYQTLSAVFMIMGPVIGTIVYENLGLLPSILITGSAFLLSALSLVFITESKNIERESSIHIANILDDMRGGIKYVLKNNQLKALGACFLFAGLAVGLIQPMNIFIVMEKLSLGTEYLQWLLMINGLGMVIGGVISFTLSSKIQPMKFLAIGVAMTAISISIIGYSTVLMLTLLGQFLYGVFLPVIQIGIHTMVLKNTNDHLIGRVNGILVPLFSGSMVMSITLVGILKSVVSVTFIFQVSACLFLVALAIILRNTKQQSLNERGQARNV